MKFCAACHQDLPKDKYSKKQWKLGAECGQRRCTSCVRDNREAVQPPPSNDIESANSGIVSTLESMSINVNEMTVSDEELFKQPPPKEDCPICFLRMPSISTGYKYKSCCGKVICSGCIYTVKRMKGALCPFCRTPTPMPHEMVDMMKKRIEVNDANAIYSLGCIYNRGKYGFPQRQDKALKLWHRAGELGNSEAHYAFGEGVEKDEKKAKDFWELAAMGGNVMARHNLAVLEKNNGNMVRAVKHYMIAADDGYSDSLSEIQNLFKNGHATKDDYGTALRAHQSYLDEVRSDQRDEDAASDNYKYY